MNKLFDFEPKHYMASFASEDYVHIRKGLNAEFFNMLSKQVNDYLNGELMEQFAIGDKQQALYEFPYRSDYDQLFDAVGTVCGFDLRSLVLSEPHIKANELGADLNPPAHKDRFASQISVGFSVNVPKDSTLVLYSYDCLETNPFQSSTAFLNSLSPDRLPEDRLRNAKRVEINDSPEDVIMFPGNRIWHLRSNAAGTKKLYLKINSYHCDFLGEDPSTAQCGKKMEESLAVENDLIGKMIPRMGRRVDSIQKRYTHEWGEETIGVVLAGERYVTIDEEDFLSLRAMDGCRDVFSVILEMGAATHRSVGLSRLRRLAARAIIDLV